MTYRTQAAIASDRALLDRVGACAASIGVENPLGWAYEHAYQLASNPEWVSAYLGSESEQDEDSSGPPEAAITDLMILSAVQALAPPPEPDTIDAP